MSLRVRHSLSASGFQNHVPCFQVQWPTSQKDYCYADKLKQKTTYYPVIFGQVSYKKT